MYVIMITKIRKFSMFKNIMYCFFSLITIIAVLNITKPNVKVTENQNGAQCQDSLSVVGYKEFSEF
jgi:hypothetical protein